jgi:lysophospholipase L1-like esterase
VKKGFFRSTSRGFLILASLAVSAGIVAVPNVSGASGPLYYLSLGDSYSVGYQPSPSPGATSGFTAVVAADKNFQLENFGCGGATTSSILTFDNFYCGVNDPTNNPHNYGPAAATDAGPTSVGQTQVQAADAFIAAHPGQIGLITVSIGGNDVTACAAAANPVSCVGTVVPELKTNVTTLVGDLRSALTAANGAKAGKKVPVVGITYPDVLLGLWVNSGPGGTPANTPTFPASHTNQTLASESQLAFKILINPALKSAYASGHAKFVDVTKKTGAYTKLTKTTKMDIPALGLGTITVPKAVAEVCTLTWYCQLANIHANNAGYERIGALIAAVVK